MGTSTKKRVQAAGGVVVRKGRVCVIHRPDYDDWSLPKGKLDSGESHKQAALREVREETGLICEIHGDELERHEYTDRKGRPKTVRWWPLKVVDEGRFRPNDEVDELRWVTFEEAERLLDYEHDRLLVRAVAR